MTQGQLIFEQERVLKGFEKTLAEFKKTNNPRVAEYEERIRFQKGRIELMEKCRQEGAW